jgi:RHS repeat-associated protein
MPRHSPLFNLRLPRWAARRRLAPSRVLSRKVDSSSHNNGNVMGITNNPDTTRSQSFSYDSLSRIATAKTSATSGSNCWGETYTVDQWANLTSIGAVTGYTGCTQEGLSVTATTNNQLSATGFSYDAAGNMQGDSVNTYGWNAESEIKSAAGVNYTYDGDGNRVQKSNGKIYWYGAGTEILDESDASGNITDEYVFFGGKRVAHRVVSSGAISYYAEDFLGSSRAITTSTGTLCYDADFYPYGGERVVTNTCAQNYKFEGKERDTETGNDDFGARYYTSKLGRWLSADWSSSPVPVPYADLTNPQTLNLYAMVRDNPETFADLDGHEVDLNKGKSQAKKLLLQNVSKQERKMFDVVKNQTTGKYELKIKAGAETHFTGTHTVGFAKLSAAIASDKVVTINVAKTFTDSTGTHDVAHVFGGGVTLNQSNGNSTVYVSPAGNPYQLQGTNGQNISDPNNIIMGHETFGHALENMTGGDTSQHRAIEVENQLRQEQHLAERKQEVPH